MNSETMNLVADRPAIDIATEVRRKYSCGHCNSRLDATATRIEVRAITLPVRGEDITLDAATRICTAWGEPVYDRKLDSETLERAYEMYRLRHDMASPEDVRSLRGKYGISQRNLALLLGWSEATINRYEKGAAPDKAHSVVLRLLRDNCATMRDLIAREGHVLPLSVRETLRRRVNELIASDAPARQLRRV